MVGDDEMGAMRALIKTTQASTIYRHYRLPLRKAYDDMKHHLPAALRSIF